MLRINSEAIKILDEYDDEESNRILEEENYGGCRTKDKTSFWEMDTSRDGAHAEGDLPERLSHVVKQILSL